MTEYIAKCNEVVGISGKTLIVPDYIDMNQEIVRCRDCDYLNTMNCPIKRALVYDGIDELVCVAPGGFCAWSKRKEGGDD